MPKTKEDHILDMLKSNTLPCSVMVNWYLNSTAEEIERFEKQVKEGYNGL